MPPNSIEVSNNKSDGQSSEVYALKKTKRLTYPGDVGDTEELDEEASQKYISVLRKSVMEQRKRTRRFMQQNRRKQERIDKLKAMLKELIEKTKNGNYIIEEAS